ncbi:glycosyltransferase family 4 protein [Tamlana agarivorans]|uniref:Glycosyltransferase family 4 protein n=1 Tax=Pseudotamlana agarivorans TaxID=481183 RepID=A0ACC5UBA3_9FLAO|nr:glycosyltransferase [Tamlana agarivorans]MBU2951618.1 glycosyltransferase family 4 protein [Tamlana agarivorans]
MFKAIKLVLRNHLLKLYLRKQHVFFDFNTMDCKENCILIIDSHIPKFNEDSGSKRLLQLIKLMLKNDFSVFLMADQEEYKYKSSYIETFKSLGVHVYEPALDKNGDLITRAIFIEKIAPKLNYAWLHRPENFELFHEIIRDLNKEVTLIYDMVDFHYLRFIREWELKKTDKLKTKAANILELELGNCKAADKIIVISEKDKSSLQNFYKDKSKMVTIGNLHQFKVRTDAFKGFSERKNLLFIGGFKHKPNVDAVLWLKNEIMPLVWAVNKDIKVDIVGSSAPQKILNLHSENFNIVGFVEDISEYFNSARIFIAPLRYGAGIKGKIGQSFEFSLPVVTTDVGAEGFDFTPFSDEMTANSAELLASKIIKLYEDPILWDAISHLSEKFIEPFSEQYIESQLKTVLDIT